MIKKAAIGTSRFPNAKAATENLRSRRKALTGFEDFQDFVEEGDENLSISEQFNRMRLIEKPEPRQGKLQASKQNRLRIIPSGTDSNEAPEARSQPLKEKQESKTVAQLREVE